MNVLPQPDAEENQLEEVLEVEAAELDWHLKHDNYVAPPWLQVWL